MSARHDEPGPPSERATAGSLPHRPDHGETLTVAHPKSNALRGNEVVGFCLQVNGAKILAQALQHRQRDRVLHGSVRDKERKFCTLHQSGHQESVLGAEGHRIKNASCNVHGRFAHRESRRIQVANASVRLQHVFLKHGEPQFLGFANRPHTISHQMELEIIVLREIGNRCRQCRKAV